MFFKKNILFFFYFLLFFFFLFEILFGEKNVFTLKKNLSSINEHKDMISNKNNEIVILKSYLENFKTSSEFRKLVIKDKLFLKNPDEKVFRFDINPE